MNCIVALDRFIRDCQECNTCIWNVFIIEPEDLPEDQKEYFDDYDKDKEFIIHCNTCNYYQILDD